MVPVTKRQLGEVVLRSRNFEDFYSHTLEIYGLNESEDTLKTSLKSVYKNFIRRWKTSNRCRKTLERKYSKWLDTCVYFSKHVVAVASSSDTQKETLKKRGRPRKSYNEASARTKKRIIKRASNTVTTPEAARVLSTRLTRKGNRAGASTVKLVAGSTPTSSRQRLLKLKSYKKACVPYSCEEALSLLIETKLSKQSYNIIRLSSKKHNVDLYPSYPKLVAAKTLCYPGNIQCSEVCCQVPLQNILDHTAVRILQTLEVQLEGEFTLHCKWGFDGSSGHSAYKQVWEEKGEVSDESVFITSFVPLVLTGDDGEVWKNPRPSSTRFCRPIRLQFVKESKRVIKEEEKYIQNEINNLQHFKREGLEIKYSLVLTMIDGKVLCALTDTSTVQCPICKQTAKSSSSWTVSKPINEDVLKYGISPLHAYIRFFEFILAISYRLGK